MAQLSSREQLKDYCLRKLGHPVISIELDNQQIEDRIDDAIEYMQDYNFNLMEKKYLAYKITALDVTNGYITVPEEILAVSRILPLFNGTMSSSNYLFNLQYHITANELLATIATGDASQYFIVRQHVATLQDLFNARPMHEFRRYTDKLYFLFDATTKLAENDYIILECHTPIESASRFYNDRFLRNYCTALMKRQWGINLSKYNEVQLPGGVKLNGWQIVDDADKEIAEIEASVDKYQEPLGFFLG